MSDAENVVENNTRPSDRTQGSGISSKNRTSKDKSILDATSQERTSRSGSSSSKKDNLKRDSNTGHQSPLENLDSINLESMSVKLCNIMLPMLNKSIEDKLKPMTESVTRLQDDLDAFKSDRTGISSSPRDVGDSNSHMDSYTSMLLQHDSDDNASVEMDTTDDQQAVDRIFDNIESSDVLKGPKLPERVATFIKFCLDQKIKHDELTELLDSVTVPENLEFC